MGRIEILTGRERRRRWSDEEKLRMLGKAEDEGVALAEVARRHDVHPQQLYAWRSMVRKASARSVRCRPACRSRSPSHLRRSPPPERCRRGGTVEVTLRNGRKLRVDAEIAPETLHRLVQTLEAA